MVAAKPMMKLFLIECSHCSLLMMSSYQRSEKALGFRASISGVKVK